MKQGQGNQCRSPGVKFEESTRRNGENRIKLKETGKKNRKKQKNGKKEHQKPKESR